MPLTLNPMPGEQVQYRGSIEVAHGPAVLLGVCTCNRCHQLAQPHFCLQLPSGRLLDHVSQHSFTREGA
jgi:hypothetical protein